MFVALSALTPSFSLSPPLLESVFMDMQVCVHTYVCCEGQRSTAGGVHSLGAILIFLFFEMGSSISQMLTIRLGWMASASQEIFCLSLSP